MADLTTVGGQEFHFDPGAVTAVADHDADSLEAVTAVYGLIDGPLSIAESAAEFLARIGVTPSFARLTRPNGMFIWIRGKAVTLIRPPPPDEYPAAAEALVSVGGLTQAVRETTAQVKAAVNAHGGKL